MDLVDRMNATEFLGREFLVWLWWKSELYEGQLPIEGFGHCELWIDTQLVLQSEELDQSALSGTSPSTTPEAREALRQGKTPTKCRLNIQKGEVSYNFLLTADTLALSSIRLPALLQDDKEERFYERMYLFEELEAIVSALYKEFLTLRCNKMAWETFALPAIRSWVWDVDQTTRDQYAEQLERSRAALETAKTSDYTQPDATLGHFHAA